MGAFLILALLHTSNGQAVGSCIEEKAFLPDKTDCERYYACVKGLPRLMKCDLGLSYDYHLEACIDDQQSQCYSSKLNNDMAIDLNFQKTLFYQYFFRCEKIRARMYRARAINTKPV